MNDPGFDDQIVENSEEVEEKVARKQDKDKNKDQHDDGEYSGAKYEL
jgi:hypothetical protein